MLASYKRIPDVEALFATADARMAELKGVLVADETCALTESDVERLVDVRGREILRSLLQGHLDLRGRAEPVGPVVGEDGIERTHRRPGATRPVLTVFGPVDVERTAYGARGASSRMPVDADLNLPVEVYSLEVQRRVAEQASRVSFDATVEEMAAHTGARVPKRQAEEEARRAAQDFDEFYAAAEIVVDPATTSPLLVLTFDGKGSSCAPKISGRRHARPRRGRGASCSPGSPRARSPTASGWRPWRRSTRWRRTYVPPRTSSPACGICSR